MLTRRELNLLRAMYLHGTVTAAAAAVHMSQPAASATLRALEDRLGFSLFSRVRRRLQLTSQGRSLIPDVLNALSAMDAVERRAVDIRKNSTERLNVGAVAIVSAMLLPRALAAVRDVHPDVAVTVRAGTALEIMEMAADHRIDLGVVVTSVGRISDRIASERLAGLNLYAVFHPDHPVARAGDALNLRVAANFGLIVLAPALPAGLSTKHALEAAGLGDRPVVEVSQSFTACEFAGQRLGVAIVETLGARYARERGLSTRRLVRLDDTELAMVFPRDRALAGASVVLRDALLASAHAMNLRA